MGCNYDCIDDNKCEITGCAKKDVELVIPSEIDGNKVVSIGEMAFFDNKKLKKITIPNTVTNIGAGAFWKCKNLEEVIFEEGSSLIKINGCGNDNDEFFGGDSDCDVLVEGDEDDYRKTYIPGPDGTFAECNKLKIIEIPDSVKTIGPRAFYECTSLKSILIPNNITEIYCEAFRDCVNLEKVTFASNSKIESMNQYEDVPAEDREDDGYNIYRLDIPDYWYDWNDTFSGCNKLKEIITGEEVNSCLSKFVLDFALDRNIASLICEKYLNNLTQIELKEYIGKAQKKKMTSIVPVLIGFYGNKFGSIDDLKL